MSSLRITLSFLVLTNKTPLFSYCNLFKEKEDEKKEKKVEEEKKIVKVYTVFHFSW